MYGMIKMKNNGKFTWLQPHDFLLDKQEDRPDFASNSKIPVQKKPDTCYLNYRFYLSSKYVLTAEPLLFMTLSLTKMSSQR